MTYDDSYTDFDNQVSIDGYKKLKNVQPTDGASCICVGSCLSSPQFMTYAYPNAYAKSKK